MNNYLVTFKHIEEITYKGWVSAESQEEAYAKVEDEPFDINDLIDEDHQGVEVVDIEVELDLDGEINE